MQIFLFLSVVIYNIHTPLTFSDLLLFTQCYKLFIKGVKRIRGLQSVKKDQKCTESR